MTNIVYIRLKKKVTVNEYKTITLQDIANITTTYENEKELGEIPVYRLSKKDNNVVIIDSFIIIKHLNKANPDLEFQLIGVSESIINIENKRTTPMLLFVFLVWILLFVGSAMTIVNFHYDVSMQEVHQRIHYLFTGEQKKFPLFLQIPYSFGLGIGMVLFMNRLFKKKLNEEPSPLEVELFNYQKNIDEYVTYYENDLNDEHKHI